MPEPPTFEDRQPTSHERMSGQSWDASYTGDAPAPWDLGQPQPAIARLVSRGVFTGSVLDAGCGTAEHALLIAWLGLPVLGVDVAGTALAMARRKASERGVRQCELSLETLHLERLERSFDTVLDSGLFHSFEDDERAKYAVSLASVTKPGGTLYILCFADEGPDPGPHPVSQQELKAAFSTGHGWAIRTIEPERIATNFHANGVSAWLATVERL